ncbi:sterol-sensing domain [Anaeramoeba flamelloides]|uniref:Sterol-sensing domain n=1 Tax=Anaeramoeba flamelloides TaxID=1746091 RepID=A0AAV7Z5E1_9EUKA|nr:sterol-sensing domain [Anaeramoeba flamelloides]
MKKANFYIRFLVNHPVLMVLISIGIPLLLSIVTFVNLNLSTEATSYGDPDDDRTKNHMALTEAQQNIEKTTTQIAKQSVSYYPFVILYEGKDKTSNVFGDEELEFILDLEKEFIQVKNYSFHCVLENEEKECEMPFSMIPDLTREKPTTAPTEPYEYPLFEYGEEIKEGRSLSTALDDQYENQRLLFGSDFDAGSQEGRYLRSIFYSGLPLEGYTSQYDRAYDQKKIYSEWVSWALDVVEKFKEKNKMNVWVGGSWWIVEKELNSMLLHDYLFLSISFVFVIVYLWVMTKSGFLASCGMFHIVLSMPFGIFIYNKIFGIQFFGSINPAGLYIIFAIGADDIFIFLNTWIHSRLAGKHTIESLTTRMQWAYPKAAQAMFITSVTTAFAFILTAMCPIVEVSVFGIFAASLVITNYLFVITYFPAIVIIYEKYFSHHHCCCCCSAPRSIPGGLLPYESEQGVFCSPFTFNFFRLFRSSKNNCEIQKGNINWDDLGAKNNASDENTKGGDKVLIGDRNKKSKRKTSHIQQQLSQTNSSYIAMNKKDFELHSVKNNTDTNTTTQTTANANADENSKTRTMSGNEKDLFQSILQDPEGAFSVNKLKMLDRFMYSYFSKFLTHKTIRKVLIVLFTCLTIFFLIQVIQLGPATKTPKDFPDWSNFENFNTILKNNFESTEESLLIIDYTFGLKTFDMSDVNTYHVNEKGKLVYDTTFDLRPTANQEYFVQLCESAFETKNLLSKDFNECIMSDFKNWVGETNFPVVDRGNNELAQLMKNFTESEQGFKYIRNVDYDEKSGDIKFISTFFKTPLNVDLYSAHKYLKIEYEKWVKFESKMQKNAPEGMQISMFSSGGWFEWMRTQEIFVITAVTGAVSSVILAFIVITLTTKNWIIGLLSVTTISSIIISTIGFMKLIGWELAVIESVCVTVLAGLTVDYVVHLAHAYHEFDAPTRIEKVQGSLYAVGSSVLSGFVTTLGSTMPLLINYLITMNKFGQFLIFSLVLSFLYAFFFFIPLISVCGPRSRHSKKFLSGNINFKSDFFKKLFRLSKKDKDNVENEVLDSDTSDYSSEDDKL